VTQIAVLQSEPALLLLAAALLGLVVGSFLNVVIHRLPLMMERAFREEYAAFAGNAGEAAAPPEPEGGKLTLATPSSRCPHCGAAIAPWHNIPLLSYLWLRGRCAHCRAAISAQYPMVELASGVLALGVIWHFGATWAGLAALGLTWALLALAVIDLRHQVLPDAITLPVLWLGLFANLFGLFTTTRASLIGAIAGYLVLWAVYQVFKLVTGKEGMGYGDFKLLALLGAWLGWQALPVVIILSSAVGALVGIALIVSRRLHNGTPMPFGPFLAAAGWLALMWGPELIQAYARFAGLS